VEGRRAERELERDSYGSQERTDERHRGVFEEHAEREHDDARAGSVSSPLNGGHAQAVATAPISRPAFLRREVVRSRSDRPRISPPTGGRVPHKGPHVLAHEGRDPEAGHEHAGATR
jgi:hypothetical protein